MYLSFHQVSRVSDVVSVGKQISLMCIGQDVRGNIKLSLKATLRQPGSETKNAVKGSAPVIRETPNILASLENVSNGEQKKSTPEELLLSKNENTASDPSSFSTPTVVIRSAAECDEEEKSSGLSKTSKSSPKRTKSVNKLKAVQSSDKESDSTVSSLLSNSLSRMKGEKHDSENNLNNQIDEETDVKTPMTPQKLKLGTKVAAKIYQIRARGLVLDLGGGIRGMYKFEVCNLLSDTAPPIDYDVLHFLVRPSLSQILAIDYHVQLFTISFLYIQSD